MARVGKKGWLPQHKKRIFRNTVQVKLRDETWAYMQEHRQKLNMGFSHFIDMAINELMRKNSPPSVDKKQYLETMLVDHERIRREKAEH